MVAGIAVTPYGTLHGAALAAALELTGFLAVLPTLGADEHAVTHHIATQHLRPAAAGARVLVRAQLSRRSRALGFVTATAWAAGDPDPTLEPSPCDGSRGHPQIATTQITKSIVRLANGSP